ncbi:hypothetical protein ACE3MZ_12830 [Paenibacillus sp. WLX1005]|uniref:hypothetical protein n=1 Tax=Paenibacillus sp. WLX1005 TaxID=3243766 RepID=UPI0039840B6B
MKKRELITTETLGILKNRPTESLIIEKIKWEAKLESIKNSGLPLPAISIAVALFSISLNKTIGEEGTFWAIITMKSIIFLTIGYLIGKLLANSQDSASYVARIKSIEYELERRKNQQKEIASAYEAALLYKKEIENSIKINKLSSEEKLKDRLKAKYCFKTIIINWHTYTKNLKLIYYCYKKRLIISLHAFI